MKPRENPAAVVIVDCEENKRHGSAKVDRRDDNVPISFEGQEQKADHQSLMDVCGPNETGVAE